jgi:tellurite resistance protein TerC
MPSQLDVLSSSAFWGSMVFRSIEQARRFFKILAGFTLLLVGVVMFFTPGPGWLVIFLGLTLLAAEFVWARRLVDHMKQHRNRIKDSVLKFGKTDSA